MKRILNFCAMHTRLLSLLALLAAIIYPFIAKSGYLIRLGTSCLMNASLAVCLNLVIGCLGQMSMGHAAFWGIGAYTAAILATRSDLPTGLIYLAAIIIVGVFSLLLGLPVLKLKGYYLTVVTLGFCEIVRLVELNWTSLTKGALGISRIPAMRFFGQPVKGKQELFYFALLLLLITVILIRNLMSSRQGLAILSIRDDEVAAASIGINVFAHKMIAFTLSAMLAGLIGAFYAYYATYIDSTLFTTGQSMQIAICAIFGGLGSIPGAIGGAIILTVLPESLRFFQLYRNLLYGIVIVVVMLVKPDGILGGVNFRYIRERLEKEKEDARGVTGC